MNLVLLEDRVHLVIAEYLSFVIRILKIQRMNMLPDFLDHLRTRKLLNISKVDVDITRFTCLSLAQQSCEWLRKSVWFLWSVSNSMR
jgi:hypothetical protein